MRRSISLLVFLFQLFVTFISLFAIYIIYALLDVNEVDLINGIGFIIFQPLFGFILTSLTIVACVVIGLPIRLLPRVRRWWLTKPVLPIFGLIAGLILCLLSCNSHFTEMKRVLINGESIEKEIPNIMMTSTGWFLTAFSLLHLYPTSLLILFKRKLKDRWLTFSKAHIS